MDKSKELGRGDRQCLTKLKKGDSELGFERISRTRGIYIDIREGRGAPPPNLDAPQPLLLSGILIGPSSPVGTVVR